jgi:ABC-2 type transport system permease protein
MKFLANPVLARELRGRIRGNRALIILVIYLTITAAVTLLVYAAAAGSFASGVNDPEAGRGIGKSIFITVMTATLIQVCVITPSLTAGTISGEKERQTYDLLIMAALPIAGLAFLFGGVSGTELLIGIVGLAVTAVCYATIGLFWSSVMRTTLAATVMAQGTIILVLLIIPFLYVVVSLLSGAFNGPSDAFSVYGLGLLLCAHPFIALGYTAISLAEGENPFLISLSSDIGEIPAPSPWIVYVLISVLVTLIFLALSVRLIRPVQEEGARTKRKAEVKGEK